MQCVNLAPEKVQKQPQPEAVTITLTRGDMRILRQAAEILGKVNFRNPTPETEGLDEELYHIAGDIENAFEIKDRQTLEEFELGGHRLEPLYDSRNWLQGCKTDMSYISVCRHCSARCVCPAWKLNQENENKAVE
jgi:hypothetical protein